MITFNEQCAQKISHYRWRKVAEKTEFKKRICLDSSPLHLLSFDNLSSGYTNTSLIDNVLLVCFSKALSLPSFFFLNTLAGKKISPIRAT